MGPPIGVSRLCGPGGPDKVWGMRLTRWSALLGVVMLAAPLRAGATSCIQPPWASTYDSPLVGEILVPVDARPWLTVGCPYEGAPDKLECSLVSESETIVLTDESIGAGACSLGRDDTVTDYPDYLHRFTPASPLTPGATYKFDCGDNVYLDAQQLRVRGDEEPAAAAEVVVTDAYYSRDDNGCCGYGDNIEVQIEDPDAQFLQEGGYLEVEYPNGQVFAYVRPEDGRFVMPATRDVFTITPVSASGERGKVVEIDGGEIHGDLVYSACNVMARGTPAALYLLLPFVWIVGHGVRRRRGS